MYISNIYNRTAETPHSNRLQQQKLKLLLVLPAAAYKTADFLFEGMDLTVAENIDEAKDIAINTTYFDAIICDAEINKKSILDFSSFLTAEGILNHTPLLLILLKEPENQKIKQYRLQGVDDVISCNTSVADLADKINILKKFKFFQNKMPYNIDAAKTTSPERHYFLKRILDVLLSSVFIIILSPLILFIALAIKLESEGPVFYRSKRAGKWYKVFTFYKFRTMVVDADSMVTDLQYMNEYKDYQTSFFFKLRDDPRVTRVGKFLRNTSLDELPQLINVLKGDMSLVGNRPLPLYEAQTITVDMSAKRFFAPAGITGLWQVKGRSNKNLTVQERINMDIDYANKHSFLYDLKILLKTPKELIQKNNV